MEATQLCGNCQKPIPADRIDIHYAYCRRNFRHCEKCSIMIDINYMEDHQKNFHSLVKCEKCDKEVQQCDLKKHSQECQGKTMVCRYCSQTLPVTDYQRHELYCGSRTKPCAQCQKLVPLREMEGHLYRCARRLERRREREASQQQLPENIPQRMNNRHISSQKGEKSGSREKQKYSYLPPYKVKGENIIKPQIYKEVVDILPISIKIGLQQRGNKRITSSKPSSNSH